jgi:hypothetical protein
MSNRLEREFPHTAWQPVPPIGPDGIQPYLDRGRQLRAEALNRTLRAGVAGLARLSRRLLTFARFAAYGADKRWPLRDYRLTRSHLTGGCR